MPPPAAAAAQTSHPLALRYNDRSPLEHMHAATTFTLMRRPGCDVLAAAIPSADERASVRETMIEMFLATDNALVRGGMGGERAASSSIIPSLPPPPPPPQHFKLVARLRKRVAKSTRVLSSTESFIEPRAVGVPATSGPGAAVSDDEGISDDDSDAVLVTDTEGADLGAGAGGAPQQLPSLSHPLDLRKLKEQRLVLPALLHSCDIGNPARRWHISTAWADRITEEFFLQGELQPGSGALARLR